MSEPVAASALTSPKTHLPAASLSRVTPTSRKRAAADGAAMPDGSFPIKDAADLKRAIQAFGRAKDKGAAKRHIIRRAKSLGKVSLLPDTWKVTASREFPGSKPVPVDQEPASVVIAAAPPTPLDDELTWKAFNHNIDADEDRQVTVAKLKAVYKRGVADFTDRPCVTAEQYAHARVNSFLRLLASGAPDSAAYVADNDLLPVSHPVKVVPPFV